MNTTLHFLGFGIHTSWHRLLEQHVDHWHRLTAVNSTEVVLERQNEGRAVFRVRVCLEVANGTLRAEASARTFKTALIEATRSLEIQIQARQDQRLQRRAAVRLLMASANATG